VEEQDPNRSRLERLESPERLSQLPPDNLLDLMAIGDGDAVLDLGAGGGYFAFPAARRTKRKVYAVDNDPFMLDVLRERTGRYGMSHVEAVKGSAEAIPLAPASVDAAIASLILHILDKPPLGVKELRRVLKPGGRGLVVEWAGPRPDGKPGHRVPLEEMQRYLEDEGLEILDVRHWADAYYSVLFRKQEATHLL
jgi:ubiquinone/menaquinone biosynthesis C-methylase UbiE